MQLRCVRSFAEVAGIPQRSTYFVGRRDWWGEVFVLDQMSRLTLPGLSAPVALYRDPYGIPHIRAESMADAFFAQGFAHAQDRLWQMEADRMKAQGRWAELVGAGGVEQDKLFRRFRLAKSAVRDYEQVQPETRQMLDAYAAGVNAYMATAERLPTEFERLERQPEAWQPWDGLSVYKVRHVLMGVWEGKAWREQLARRGGAELLARLYDLSLSQEGEPLILPPGGRLQAAEESALAELKAILAGLAQLHPEDEAGSNNWVVSGQRTASGKPLLAGDPHRAVDVPNVYYQNHVACDRFDVAGLSFPGLPGFPHFGHNGQVAWSITHTGADTQDLFVERFDPANPNRYWHQGEWKEATLFQERIQVRGGEPVSIEVVVTCHGGVIAGEPASGSAVAMQYTATEPGNTGWDCLLPMLEARTCAEMDSCMAGWVDPVNNLLTADIHGAIGYRMRGRVPVRSARNGWLPVQGWSGECDWQGSVPFAELPASFDPPEGYLLTANNQVVGPEYPYYLAHFWSSENRALRIQERLLAEGSHTPQSMMAIHADLLSRPALQFLGLLGELKPQSAAGQAAREILSGWDGQMKAEQSAPVIYATLREELLRALIRPLVGNLEGEAFDRAGRGGPSMLALIRGRIMREAVDGNTRLLPPGATWAGVLTEALERAVQSLTERLGPDMAHWSWGQLHQLRPVHPLSPALSPAPSPMDGDSDTVQAASFQTATGFVVTGTSVARYLFDLADLENSRWVVPHGASGEHGSRHAVDQHGHWLAHELVPMLYSWTRIEAEAESCQQLLP